MQVSISEVHDAVDAGTINLVPITCAPRRLTLQMSMWVRSLCTTVYVAIAK